MRERSSSPTAHCPARKCPAHHCPARNNPARAGPRRQRRRQGAKEYPGIGRFGGSVIIGYRTKHFDATTVQAKPFKSGEPADERRVEGRITRITYRTGAGPSILEVARNFATQLDKASFETLLACDTKECGGLAFSRALDALPTPPLVVDYNMSLSKKRAEAVATALTRDYKIAMSRLRTAGVGYLARVGSNATDDGRALNRRVILVAP